jgi:hypothetical protein
MNSANQRTIGREYVHSVESLVRPSGGGPHIAIDVTPNPV